jgi:hypothetical protein
MHTLEFMLSYYRLSFDWHGMEARRRFADYAATERFPVAKIDVI